MATTTGTNNNDNDINNCNFYGGIRRSLVLWVSLKQTKHVAHILYLMKFSLILLPLLALSNILHPNHQIINAPIKVEPLEY